MCAWVWILFSVSDVAAESTCVNASEHGHMYTSLSANAVVNFVIYHIFFNEIYSTPRL